MVLDPGNIANGHSSVPYILRVVLMSRLNRYPLLNFIGNWISSRAALPYSVALSDAPVIRKVVGGVLAPTLPPNRSVSEREMDSYDYKSKRFGAVSLL